MGIKDTEVENNIEETDPTSIPITSEPIVESNTELDNDDTPTYKPKGDDDTTETIVTPMMNNRNF